MRKKHIKKIHHTPKTQNATKAPQQMRLPHFLECSADAATVLAGLYLVIVGVGSIGMNIAEKAARLGVETICLIDPGRFKPASKLTHPVASSVARSGAHKARLVAKRCHEINSAMTCFYANCRIEELTDLRFLQNADMVILASDNLAAEVVTGLECLRFGKPLLHCAVHGDSLVAQVRHFSHRDQNTPCICCSFSEHEKEQLNQSVKYSCTGSSVDVSAPPTMSTAFMCSLASDLGLTVLVRQALSLGESLADCQLDYHGYTLQILTTRLRKSPSCVCDHTPWRVRPLEVPVRNQSLAALSRAASDITGVKPTQLAFRIRGMQFVEMGTCQCGHLHPVRRFACPRQKLATCSRCGGAVFPHPFFSHDMAPSAAVKAVKDIPLGKLGATQAHHVLVRTSETHVLLFDQLPA